MKRQTNAYFQAFYAYHMLLHDISLVAKDNDIVEAFVYSGTMGPVCQMLE